MISTLTLAPLCIPEDLGQADAGDFRQVCELTNLAEVELWGNDDHSMSFDEQLAASQPGPYRAKAPVVAKVGEDVVGVAKVVLPLGDNEHVGYVYILIHPDYRRQGIGSQLYSRAEAALRRNGRNTLMGVTDHRAEETLAGEAEICPGSGTGSVPSSSAAVQFATSVGCCLEQVERISILQLAQLDGVGLALEGARAVAGTGFDVVYWEDHCPEDLVGNYSQLRQRMSVDVPAGGLEIEEEAWDVARVRHSESETLRRGNHSLVAAARNLGSGQLVGHTIIEYGQQKPAVLYQEDTLVLTALRGHRLGMMLKAANLARIAREHPRAERIYTWNAAENAHMLSINEALGFVPHGFTGMWQKTGFGAQETIA